MSEPDVFVEVIINERDVLQFFSTPEYYKTLFEDREALMTTVRTAFKEGVLNSAHIKNVEEIQSVRFLSEVVNESVEVTNAVEEVQVEDDFQEYEVIEETEIENLTSSETPEEVVIDVGLSPGRKKNRNLYHSSNSDTDTPGGSETNKHEIHPNTIKEEFIECETIMETTDILNDGETMDHSNLETHAEIDKNASEVRMLVSDENVITSIAEEEFEIIGDYTDGLIVSNETPVDCMPVEPEIEESRPKIGFLNKKQTEKLKEFKRLLQEGTINGAPPKQWKESMERAAVGLPIDNVQLKIVNTDRENENRTIPELTVVDNDNNNSSVEVKLENSEQYVEEYIQDDNCKISDCNLLCELCGYSAETLSELKLHISVHTGEVVTNSFKCDECSFETSEEFKISRHKELVHGPRPVNSPPFVCEFCSFKTGSKDFFLAHCEIHENAKFKCKICELKVVSQSIFNEHSKTHIGEEPFECYYCAYLTARKYHLRRHMKRKHTSDKSEVEIPVYDCYTCGYRTDKRYDFLKHRGDHKVEQPNVYRCTHCLYIGITKDNLEKHLNEHFSAPDEINEAVEFVEIVHEDTEEADPDVQIENNTSENIETGKQRTPLKEFSINASDSDNTLDRLSKATHNISPRKSLLREDYKPITKRRRGLKSLGNKHGVSLIEERLTRKFNFNVKNLCPSDEDDDSSFILEFTGEVLKSHGSLRKFSNFGVVVNKSDSEMSTVMANIENEEQLKTVTEQIQTSVNFLESNEGSDEVQFTIFFKDIEECGPLGASDILSDLDELLSSDSDHDSLNNLGISDIESDNEDDVAAVEDPLPTLNNPIQVQNKPAPNEISHRDYRTEVIFRLDELDEAQFLEEKIKQLNKRKKEARLQKILTINNNKKVVKRQEKASKPDARQEYDEGKLVIDET